MKKYNLLFVCTVNRMRSATAHVLFGNDERFEVDSAGTSQSAATILTSEHIDWADCIIVMGPHHRKFIKENFGECIHKKKIVCLHIPDAFYFMQPELIVLLKDKIEHAFTNGLL